MTVVYNESSVLAGTDDGGTGAGVNERMQLQPNSLSAATGSIGVLTLLWGTASASVTGALTNCYIGQMGATAPDFAGDQVQVKFGGSASCNSGPALVVTSDAFTLAQAWDNTKNYIVSWHTLSTETGVSESFGALGGTMTTLWFSATAQTDNAASTHDATLTSSNNAACQFVETLTITASTVYIPYDPWPLAAPVAAQKRGQVGWSPFVERRRIRRMPPRHLLIPDRQLVFPFRRIIKRAA